MSPDRPPPVASVPVASMPLKSTGLSTASLSSAGAAPSGAATPFTPAGAASVDFVALLLLGRQRGYLTPDDVVVVLESVELNAALIDAVIGRVRAEGIEWRDDIEADDGLDIHDGPVAGSGSHPAVPGAPVPVRGLSLTDFSVVDFSAGFPGAVAAVAGPGTAVEMPAVPLGPLPPGADPAPGLTASPRAPPGGRPRRWATRASRSEPAARRTPSACI